MSGSAAGRLCRVLIVLWLAVFSRMAAPASGQASSEFSAELIFPLHPEHNHAPGIAELRDGELIVSWYRGAGERSADNVAVWGARLKPGETQWSPGFVMADTPGFPDCNTCLMTDSSGRLWLFWPVIVANSWESCITRFRVSGDPSGTGCPEWNRDSMMLLKPEDFREAATAQLERAVAAAPERLSDRQQAVVGRVRERLGDKLFQRLGWQPRCKPTVLPSGRILLPLYSDTFSLSLMAISDDGGDTWTAGRPLLGFGAIQPTVLRRNDGTLVAWLRENGYTGSVRRAESADEGVSWSEVGVTDIRNPGSGLDGVRLANGHWILVCNDTAQGRHRLKVFLSEDEGRSWPVSRALEDQEVGSFHYPAVIQTRDQRIHVVYSYFVESGKSMKHVSFGEDWVRGSGN